MALGVDGVRKVAGEIEVVCVWGRKGTEVWEEFVAGEFELR